MSTPSMWQAGGVRGDPLDLDAIMVVVLLHEGSHVAQIATYGQRVGALAESNHLRKISTTTACSGASKRYAGLHRFDSARDGIVRPGRGAADDAAALRLRTKRGR